MYCPKSEEERRYLENYNSDKYRKPCVTVDFIVSYAKNKEKYILLIKRKNFPYKNFYALPGGFLDVGKENTVEAAIRELKEETSLVVNSTDCKLVGVYSDPDRDPRDHVISIVYSVEIDDVQLTSILAADDAISTSMYNIKQINTMIHDSLLAFDHYKILSDYINR